MAKKFFPGEWIDTGTFEFDQCVGHLKEIQEEHESRLCGCFGVYLNLRNNPDNDDGEYSVNRGEDVFKYLSRQAGVPYATAREWLTREAFEMEDSDPYKDGYSCHPFGITNWEKDPSTVMSNIEKRYAQWKLKQEDS